MIDIHKFQQRSGGREVPIPPHEYYGLIRSHLDSENSILGQKMSWLVGSQAFLYIAYINVLNSPEIGKTAAASAITHLFLWLTPLTGLSISVFTYVGILISNAYLTQLRKTFERYPKNEIVLLFPPIQGDQTLRTISDIALKGIPLIFIGTWIFSLILQFKK